MGRFVLMGGASLLLMSGCGRVARMDAREQNHRLIAEAYEQIDAGAFREASRLFREALDLHPTMARPHLDLAMILHEHRRDYVRAIYHYQRYLELRPGTEKESMIQQRIEEARAALVVAYGGGVVDQPAAEEKALALSEADAARVAAEAQLAAAQAAAEAGQQIQQRLRQDLDTVRLALAQREELVQTQRTELQQLRGQVRQLEDLIEQRRVPASDTVPPDETDAAAAERIPMRTYEVRANDSLSGIAHRVYGDASKWRLIQAANREVLGSTETLRIGQILIIPDIENRR